MTDTGDTIAEFGHGTKIVLDDGQYHYVNPMGDRVQSFDSEDRARLYADIQTVVGGFREGKTGERGIPPAVARALDENLLIAYQVATPTMGVTYAARAFGISESEVRSAADMIQDKAEQLRDGDD